MKLGSLFSGIGGIDLGLERAGMTCVWQAENDAAASKILSRHWPNVRNLGDVRNVKKGKAEPVDVIAGGFPCQDVSVAGKRAGLAGERSGLWHEFARIIDVFGPRWVVIENVPGLLSSHKGRDFATIIRWLAERGYGVAWRILDAQYFGLAQRRKRVFVVASLGSGRCAEVLFESESLPRDPAQSREEGQGLAAPVTADHPSRRNGGSNPTEGAVIAATLQASGAGTSRPAGMGSEPDFLVADTITAQYASNRGAQAGNASKVTNLIAAPIAGHHPRTDLDTETFVVGAVSSKWAKGTGGPAGDEAYNLIPDVVGSLDSGGSGGKGAHGGAWPGMTVQSMSAGHAFPAPLSWDKAQITSKEHGSKPSEVAQPLNTLSQMMVGVRRLTPTECERLQGFPDGWTDTQSDSARYRQLGNAVAVPVLEWIGRRIVVVDAGGKP
jgi:DNA (cytosine-5)-methyltransferase 1